MSYRYAMGTLGRPVSPARRRLGFWVCALMGIGAGATTSHALGIATVSIRLAAGAFVAALVLAAVSASGNQPVGAAYFPRSDGRWIDLGGTHTADVRQIAGVAADAPLLGAGAALDEPRQRPAGAAPLTAGFAAGLAAATVCARRRTSHAGAGDRLHELTVLVAAPGRAPYRTRILLRMLPDDRRRLAAGNVLLAARFGESEPDIALLSAADIDSLTPGEQRLADEVLAAAAPPDHAPRTPLWDSRSYRRIARFSSAFWAIRQQRPDMLLADLRRRHDTRRYLTMSGVLVGAFAGTLAIAAVPHVLGRGAP